MTMTRFLITTVVILTTILLLLAWLLATGSHAQTSAPSLMDDPFKGNGSPFWGAYPESPKNPFWATPGATTSPFWGSNQDRVYPDQLLDLELENDLLKLPLQEVESQSWITPMERPAFPYGRAREPEWSPY